MTTNALDKKKLIVSSDSRWSFAYPNMQNPTHVIYVDDTGFEKIVTSDVATLVFAGDGLLISGWKNWLKQDEPDWDALPPTERDAPGMGLLDISICVVESDGAVLFDSGECLMHGTAARFAGSGRFYARDCFMKNMCGITAVDTAATYDPFTGGTTRYLELKSGVNNLMKVEETLQEAEQQLRDRGFVMEIATGNVTPLKSPEETHAEAVQALQSGGVHLSAPTGHASRKWTADEKQSLRAALEHVYAKRAKKSDV